MQLSTIHQEALDLKDRYARFLDEHGRLAARGDIHEFSHTLVPSTRLRIGPVIGKGKFATVEVCDLLYADEQAVPLVRRTHRHGLEMKTAMIDAHRRLFVRDGDEQRAEHLATIERACDTERADYIAQLGYLLGLSLDRGLDPIIAPIIGHDLAIVPFAQDLQEAQNGTRKGLDIRYEEHFHLYQHRAITTLQDAFAKTRAAARRDPTRVVALADLIDATVSLVERTLTAGYVDADLKSENIGLFLSPDGRKKLLRTIDVAELRPVNGLDARLRAWERREGTAVVPTYFIGSITYTPARRLDAYDDHSLASTRARMLPQDATASLALVLADELFGLYDAIRVSPSNGLSIERRVREERYRFTAGLITTPEPILEPYREPLMHAIAADLDGRAVDLTHLRDRLAGIGATIRGTALSPGTP